MKLMLIFFLIFTSFQSLAVFDVDAPIEDTGPKYCSPGENAIFDSCIPSEFKDHGFTSQGQYSQFNIDKKFGEAETNLKKWFNYAAILFLIVAAFLWLRGKMNFDHMRDVFFALIIVSSVSEVVAWFSG